MGAPWRMFTKIQAEELISGTNSTWTTINGKNGRKLTSKTNTSKYIFLPAGGYWSDTTHNSAGSWGYYWSTKQYTTTEIWAIMFNSNYSPYTMKLPPTYGQSVRAIQTISFKVLIRKSSE